jgi:tRNA-uridine 2-sulfurtransferase
MSRVLVAMSGGVDSAVAAALLVEQGHDVTGVHLKLADVPEAEQVPGHGCCTLDDAQDARRTAQVLGIPFYVWDLGDVFEREVQGPFAESYAAGVTPNPCVTCNERVKYAALLERAVATGFDALATGHHARLRRDGRPAVVPGGGTRLLRAVDRAKDQSYVLYMATPEQLDRTLLPVGELRKDEVRSRAARSGCGWPASPTATTCASSRGATRPATSRTGCRSRPGRSSTSTGREVGRHDGVWRYTVGQRRGLRLDTPPGEGRPGRRFVVDVDAVRSTVVVGPREALACHWADIDAATWTSGRAPEGEVRVQVRAHGATVRGRVGAGERAHDGTRRVRLELDEPVHGLAVGQAAVVYDAADEICLGGGRVARAQRPALPVA